MTVEVGYLERLAQPLLLLGPSRRLRPPAARAESRLALRRPAH